jgi:hypothetical protein
LFLIGVDERENTAMWLFAWIFVAYISTPSLFRTWP